MEASNSRRGRRALAAAAVLALGLAVTPSAMAGEAEIVNGQLQYDAFVGETNNVTVEQLPDVGLFTPIRVKDVVPITSGDCAVVSNVEVECLVGDPQVVNVFLGNGNDRLAPATGTVFNIDLSVRGNTGNDAITGGSEPDTIDGQDGKDTLRGGDDGDALFGGGNDDDLQGQAGADAIEGQLGADTLNGGTGLDKMFGGDGKDTLNGDDNAGGDLLNCGTGLFVSDLAIFNTGDTVSTNCDLLQLVD